jgi:hypothetical protein
MGKIEISEESIKKINAFKKLINYILGHELPARATQMWYWPYAVP